MECPHKKKKKNWMEYVGTSYYICVYMVVKINLTNLLSLTCTQAHLRIHIILSKKKKRIHIKYLYLHLIL